MRRRAHGWICLAVLALRPGVADAAWALRQDRLTGNSEGMPLPEFLRSFHEAGASVNLDPELSAQTVTGSATNEPLERALERLVPGMDFTIAWERLEGPAGPVDRALEIRLFQRGRPEAARPAFGGTRLDVVEAGGTRFVRGQILIGFRSGTTREQAARILEALGGEVIRAMPGIGAFLIRIPPGTNIPELIERLRREERVAAAEPNYVYDLPSTGGSGRPGSREIASKAGSGGKTALLAVLDSGITGQEGLDALVTGSYNSLQNGEAGTDTLGHGTQMAWIASGLISPDGGQAAEITSRNILSIKGFDESGRTSSWAMMEAVRIATEKKARVMNISWGSETASAFLQTALRSATDQGMILVAAVGNQPTGKAMYPSAWPGILAVGAADAAGAPSDYSNYGTHVDLSAPANARLPVGHDGPPGAYTGTSIASAYTAGVLAQYLEAHPEVTADNALLRLREALTPFQDSASAGRNGAGVLDAAAVRKFLSK